MKKPIAPKKPLEPVNVKETTKEIDLFDYLLEETFYLEEKSSGKKLELSRKEWLEIDTDYYHELDRDSNDISLSLEDLMNLVPKHLDPCDIHIYASFEQNESRGYENTITSLTLSYGIPFDYPAAMKQYKKDLETYNKEYEAYKEELKKYKDFKKSKTKTLEDLEKQQKELQDKISKLKKDK